MKPRAYQYKKKHPRASEEHKLQVAAVKYMNWALPGTVEFFACSNNPRSAITGALEKQRGMKAGVGDICVFGEGAVPGEVFVGFLEFKSEKGRQSPKQKEFEARCRECGAEYAIIRSLDELRENLEQWGLV